MKGVGDRLRKAATALKEEAAAKARRALLMPHEERQALIRKPFSITYFPPVKRHGGVQLINDENWMKDREAWEKRYMETGLKPETNADLELFVDLALEEAGL